MVIPAIHFLKLFALGYPAFMLLDSLFLGVIMRGVYQSEVGSIARSYNGQMQISIAPGVLVWALIVIGSIILALPHARGGTLAHAFAWGAFYGLVLYGTYDLTNYAVLARWTLFISVIDIAWGMLSNGLLLMWLVWLDAKLS